MVRECHAKSFKEYSGRVQHVSYAFMTYMAQITGSLLRSRAIVKAFGRRPATELGHGSSNRIHLMRAVRTSRLAVPYREVSTQYIDQAIGLTW